MRALDEGLAAHLAGGETTLAYCWRVIRNDAVVLGFTDHDLALEFDGTVFAPADGLDGAEMPSRLGGQVDTGEVLGVLTSAAIGEDDILLGRYDGAEVETWRVNWRAVAQRVLLRRDTIGEIVREDGIFRAELRSGQQALNGVYGRIYQALCDAELGDGRCGVDVEQAAFRGFAVVVTVEASHSLVVEGIGGFEEGWFGFGKALWTDGKRQGLGDRIVAHQRIGTADVLSFAAPVGEWVAVGDALTVTAGCDRRFATCRARFGNAVNFRGFPHIPGSDYVLRHPRSGDALDGRAVVT